MFLGGLFDWMGNAWDTVFHGGANHKNAEINASNLQLQKDTFNYQKNLQTEIFNREDNAVQRRVDDMRKAGLSPLANVQGAGAGATVGVTAPQQAQQLPTNGVNELIGLISAIGSMKNMSAQTKLLDAQANKTQQEANLYSSEKSIDILLKDLDYKLKDLDYRDEMDVRSFFSDWQNAEYSGKPFNIEERLKGMDFRAKNKVKSILLDQNKMDFHAKHGTWTNMSDSEFDLKNIDDMFNNDGSLDDTSVIKFISKLLMSFK